MKKRWHWGLLSFFIAMVILGSITMHSIYRIQSHGQLINYVGIVRGATQRLVKLELSGESGDQLVGYLDGILDNLATGEGEYGLIHPEDPAYLDCLDKLEAQWQDVKRLIYASRSDPALRPELMAASETYFAAANDTVFAAQNYSSHQTRLLTVLIALLMACVLAVWLFIFWSDVKRMLKLEHTNRDLSDKAGRDPLTGAYTAERFKSVAQTFLDHDLSLRYAVFYVDFTDFKYINDVFGYACGDGILRQYAACIQDDLSKDETFGRINADNFAILRRYRDKEELLERQKAVDRRITEYMTSSFDKQSLSVCCGVCCVEDVVENLKIEGLMDRANFARKTVKNGTYDRYRFYDESIRRQLFLEKHIESSMADALRDREFVVYYQPKVSLHTGQIACAEALVRWQKPDGTLVRPDEFIPVFEKNYTITLLDRYVFETVCAFLRDRLDAGRPVQPVAVNVSRLQFYHADFIPTYAAIREKYAVPASLLEIEFTETILIDNWALVAKIVGDLQQLGFTCAIDDFGKGYSSLSAMKNLNIDVLKIDAMFFQDLSWFEKDRKLVKGIVDLVRQFGITTVAEGIEHMEQVEFLRGIQCDMIQGYVFHRPMPEGQYGALLDTLPGGPGR